MSRRYFSGGTKSVQQRKQQRQRLRFRIDKAAKRLLRIKTKKKAAKKKMAGRGSSFAEVKIRYQLEKEGYTVHQAGWPDFCAVRGSEVRLIEVKTPTDSVSPVQESVHRALALLGITVEVVCIPVNYVEQTVYEKLGADGLNDENS